MSIVTTNVSELLQIVFDAAKIEDVTVLRGRVIYDNGWTEHDLVRYHEHGAAPATCLKFSLNAANWGRRKGARFRTYLNTLLYAAGYQLRDPMGSAVMPVMIRPQTTERLHCEFLVYVNRTGGPNPIPTEDDNE